MFNYVPAKRIMLLDTGKEYVPTESETLKAKVFSTHLLGILIISGGAITTEITYCGHFTVEWDRRKSDDQLAVE